MKMGSLGSCDPDPEEAKEKKEGAADAEEVAKGAEKKMQRTQGKKKLGGCRRFTGHQQY